MTNSKVHTAARPSYIPFMVSGHKYSGQQPVSKDDYFINGVMGDKGVYSTVTDMLKFDQALYSDYPVKQSTLQLGFSPGSPESAYSYKNYGFGFRLRYSGGRKIVYHNGWWQGFKTAFKRYVDDNKTLIVFTNSDKKFPLPYILEQLLLNDGKTTAALDSIVPDEE
jgi:CubicO group peptidase (beta-lactamase class C family)